MNDQYYTREPSSASHPRGCAFSYRGHSLQFQTDAGVFSKGELDEGSELLLESLPADISGPVLDMGCGWGPIGLSIAAAHPAAAVTLADVNLRALELARRNAATNRLAVQVVESDGLNALAGQAFRLIVTNPPIRAGKQVIYRLFAQAAAALTDDGQLWLVIRKQQGAESAQRYLQTLFGQVERVARDKGFWILKCTAPKQREEEA